MVVVTPDNEPFIDLVQVRAEGAFGTGLLVGRGLVLTALHCVCDPKNGWQARNGVGVYPLRALREKDDRHHNARIVWPRIDAFDKDPPDVALLQIDEVDPPVALAKHRFAELPRVPTTGSARGFPKTAKGPQLPGGRIEHDQPGRVNYTAWTRPTLTIDATGRHELEGRERWAGLSGGPLLVNRFIVGVMREVPEGWKGEAVEAEPLAPLLRHPDDASLRTLLDVSLPLIESTGKESPTITSPFDRITNLDRPRRDYDRYLVGRDDLWENILTRCTPFPRADSPVRIVLYGTPGIGKSSLAYQIARLIDRQAKPTLSWWLQTTDEFTLEGPLLELARRLGIEVRLGTTLEQLTGQLLSKISNLPSWILVLDDAPGLARARALQPTGKGLLIVTSRNPEWGEWGSSQCAVDLLSENDAIEFLQKNCVDATPKELADISRAVGYLPIGLVQIAVYIEATDSRISDVIHTLSQAPLDILDDVVVFEGYDSQGVQTVRRTLRPIVDDLQANYKRSADLFLLLVHFGERVPWNIISDAALSLLDIPKRLERSVLVPLTRRSLLTRDRGDLVVHGLIARVGVALAAINDMHLTRATSLLTSIFPDTSDSPEQYRLANKLLPAMYFFLRVARPGIDAELLFQRLGRHLILVGDHKHTLPMGRTLSLILKRRITTPPIYFADVLTSLGRIIHQAGQLRRARVVFRFALRTIGSNHSIEARTIRARIWLELSSLLGDGEQPRLAYSIARKVETILERGEIADEFIRVQAIVSVVALLGPEAALKKIDEGFSRWGRYLARDSFDAMALLLFKARSLRNLYMISRARAVYEQALSMANRLYGEIHTEYGNILHDIGMINLCTGFLGEADVQLHQAAEIIGQTYRKDHTAYATTLRDLALLYLAQGKESQAAHAAETAVSIVRAAPPSTQWRIVPYLTVLARCYGQIGQVRDAKSIADEAVRRGERLKDYPHVVADALRERAFAETAIGNHRLADMDLVALRYYRAKSEFRREETIALDVLCISQILLIRKEVDEASYKTLGSAYQFLVRIFGGNAPDAQRAKELMQRLQAISLGI